jgi:hypothetical protein
MLWIAFGVKRHPVSFRVLQNVPHLAARVHEATKFISRLRHVGVIVVVVRDVNAVKPVDGALTSREPHLVHHPAVAAIH